MKKEIEQVTHLPIKQQSWTGLMGAKDSVRYRNKTHRKFVSLFLL